MRSHLHAILFTAFIFGNGFAQDESDYAFAENMESFDDFTLPTTIDCFGYEDALRYLDLDVIINHSGPFTIFTPNREAFDQVAAVNSLDKKSLYALTTYHLVAGKITAAKILQMINRGEGKATLTTVQGSKLELTLKGLDITHSDKTGRTAIITKADQYQGHSISHAISGVLQPQILQ
jgi:uncharacterized surface protein with fasciclin (FAS1) repeats